MKRSDRPETLTNGSSFRTGQTQHDTLLPSGVTAFLMRLMIGVMRAVNGHYRRVGFSGLLNCCPNTSVRRGAQELVSRTAGSLTNSPDAT